MTTPRIFPKIQWPLPLDHKPLWQEDILTRHDPDHEWSSDAHQRLFGFPVPPPVNEAHPNRTGDQLLAYMDLGDSFIFFYQHCIYANYCDGCVIYPPIPNL